MIEKKVKNEIIGRGFKREIDDQESSRRRHTSRRACSFAICVSSYAYTGFTSVPGAGLVSSLVVLVMAAQERKMDTMET
jgi:hypothetical protein